MNSQLRLNIKSKPNMLHVMACLVAPISVLIYSLTHCCRGFLAKYIACFTVLQIAVFLFYVIIRQEKVKIFFVAMIFYSMTYVLLELSTFLLLCFNLIRPDMRFYFRGIEATDKPLAQYDTITGYKPIAGEFRYLSVSNGVLEMDHKVYANNHNCYSKRQYFYQKQHPKIKRYIVFGDSFSSGIVVSTSWPDLLQRNLQISGNDSVELYNFSVDGSGIQNWNNIFFKIIVPKYDFDGIIIAPSAEKEGVPDFDRKFIVANSMENQTMLTAVDITEQNLPQTFTFDNAVPITSIYNNAYLNSIKEQYVLGKQKSFDFHWVKPDLHFIAMLCGVTDGLYKLFKFTESFNEYSSQHRGYEQLASKEYCFEYFKNRYKYADMLVDILNYAKVGNKKIVFVGIPDVENVKDYLKGKPNIYRSELYFLSKMFKAAYFDGFNMFAGKSEAFVDSCFYRHDKHWNEKGVDLFAKSLLDSGIIN